MPIIEDYFIPKRSKAGYIEDYVEGKTPLVSATLSNNGIAAYVDAEPVFKAPAISVERVTGTAFVQTTDFITVPDDVNVLMPKVNLTLEQLYTVASIINNSRWRFSFGRKLTPKRLKALPIPSLDKLATSLPKLDRFVIAARSPHKKARTPKFGVFGITSFFDPVRGDFHALDRLKEGKVATVSRISEDNGIVGYFEKPRDARIYPPLTLTVSSVTGDAFVQPFPFIATDNVLVLLPKSKFSPALLYFFQAMINRERWRCSYGRQLYREKFSKTEVYLPVHERGIDTEFIEEVMGDCTYWAGIENYAKAVASEVERYSEGRIV